MARLRIPSTRILTSVLIFFFVSHTGHIGAEQKSARNRARLHFDQALRHVDQHRHEAAVTEFWKAYEAHPNYRVLFNIAQANVLLGRPAEALRTFQRYLDEAGEHLPESRRLEVEAEMARLRTRVGELVVTVEPTGASIQLDGKDVTASIAKTPFSVDPGGHALRVSLDGHLTVVRTLSVAAGEHVNMDIHLTPAADPKPACKGYGQLRVTCDVPEADVRINGRSLGSTPLTDAVLLPTGAYTLEFTRPGYVFEAGSVVVPLNRVASASCRAKVAQDALGRASAVRITLAAPGAYVLDNGQPLDKTAKLPPGLHDLVIHRPGYRAWRRSIRLKPGETRRIDAHLTPTTREALDQVQNAHEQRLWAYGTMSAGLALGIGAVVHGLWNHGRYERWDKEQERLATAWSSPSPDAAEASSRQADNDELLQSIHAADRVTVGLAVGTGALISAGVVLYLTGDDPHGYDGAFVEPSAGGGTLGLRETF